MKSQKILIISGPTATGKTQLAFRLAEKFNGELISADSRQVYRGMDIVTGKELPVKFKVQNSNLKIGNNIISYYAGNDLKVWGYDVVEPNQEWSASHFVKFAKKVIADVHQRGKLPIIVGGTGLYISNLLNPPETLNIPPDNELRRQLNKLSLPELQNMLRRLNEKRFNQMNNSDQHNPRRLIRAIEVIKYRELHKKGLAFLKRPGLLKHSGVLHIALTAPIEEIDRRIEDRVRQRIEKGAEGEVRELVEKYGWDSALKFTIGYKEWKPYREGTESRESCKAGSRSAGQRERTKEIVKLWTTHEKQYARRQLTWVAKYSPDKFFDITQKNYREDIEAYAGQWYHGKS